MSTKEWSFVQQVKLQIGQANLLLIIEVKDRQLWFEADLVNSSISNTYTGI